MKENKKGYTLMIDALIALIFMLFIITTIYSMSFSRNAKTDIMSFKELHYVSEDVLDVLNKNGVLDNVSTNWAVNSSYGSQEMIDANNLTRMYLDEMLPPDIGYNLTIEEGALTSVIAASNSSRPAYDDSSTGTHSTRVLVGYGSGKPTLSYSSRASLNALSSSVFSRYIYFGGFEGQGNITKFIDLPDDAQIVDAHMQLNPGADFDFYINDQFTANYPGVGASLTANDIDLTPYKDYFTGGRNWININFTENESNFIGGGYLRVDYTTSKWNELPDFSTYWFPGIKGFINLYSSFYAPGRLTDPDMVVHLHYRHNISGGVNVYLDIAGHRVYENSTTGDNIVRDIYRDELMNKTGFCPLGVCNPTAFENFFSNKTIPFKFGTDTFTFAAGGQGTADAVLITDVSGSMMHGGSSSIPCNTQILANSSLYDCTSSGNYYRDKINVAKQVDKTFVTKMLDYNGTKVGLVSYSTGPPTSSLGLTINEGLLNSTVDSYSAGGSTCISCGVNQSTEILRASGYKDLITAGGSWRYFVGAPPVDGSGRKWNNSAYTDSAWSSGNAILGYEPVSTNPAVTTTTGSLYLYPNLWDRVADLPQPVDFTSGLNYTHTLAAPTFGMGATRNDGWDWAKGVYGGTTTSTVVTFNNHIQESGNWRIMVQAFGRESGTGRAASGAYGVQFNVTPAMRTCIVNGGTATLSFDYRTVAAGLSNPEAYTIYARLNNSAGLQTYTVAGPSRNSIGWTPYANVVTGKITTSGMYYLDFGPSITSTGAAGDNVQAYFDNVNLAILCPIPRLYFRKNFTVANPSLLTNTVISILSDDHAEIYINGRRVDNTSTHYRGAYWNRVVKVNQTVFVAGQNNIAVKLYNDDNTRAKFDLRLGYKNDSRKKAMLVMSDGMANRLLNNTGPGSGGVETDQYAAEAIYKACDARTYNFTVYAVAFGSDADQSTLKKVACWDCNACSPTLVASSALATCWLPHESFNNCSRFYSGNNASALSKIYATIAQQIANASLSLQMINITFGSVSLNNTIYPDSYMKFYTTTYPTLSEDESLLTVESNPFPNTVSNGSFTVPAMTRPIDAKVTSYSGAYWTKSLRIKGKNTSNVWQTVYNLTTFGTIYDTLGDPYIVNIPIGKVGTGTNYAEIKTGASPTDNHGGSQQDKVIYILAIKMLSAYSQPQKTNEGCNWTVEFFDGTTAYVPAPYGYSGPRKCNYTSSTYLAKKYDNKSAVNEAVYNLFRQLDSNPYNGRLDVKFNPRDLVIDTTTVGGVRSLWGPVRVKLMLWM